MKPGNLDMGKKAKEALQKHYEEWKMETLASIDEAEKVIKRYKKLAKRSLQQEKTIAKV